MLIDLIPLVLVVGFVALPVAAVSVAVSRIVKLLLERRSRFVWVPVFVVLMPTAGLVGKDSFVDFASRFERGYALEALEEVRRFVSVCEKEKACDANNADRAVGHRASFCFNDLEFEGQSFYLGVKVPRELARVCKQGVAVVSTLAKDGRHDLWLLADGKTFRLREMEKGEDVDFVQPRFGGCNGVGIHMR